ncbi:thioesterase II family protein [Pedobacter roseus]|uniref:Thioesterase n=1 Tax=Pedobacter roseus TaxID=336820 RepID=A0A7G9QKT4_9SPHI|nr:thioesterase [Pedobacter roseus]QNN43959.1 thioesterase [Pedobacter roseus]
MIDSNISFIKKKAKLFLLHYAGGNVYSYQFLIPLLNDFDVIPLELPGRGKRAKEPLLKLFEEVSVDLYNLILNQVQEEEFLIYGHSMGAYLGLKITDMLNGINKKPVCLIVSGNPGPGIKDDLQRHLLDDCEFIRELKKIGGIPSEIFANNEVLNYFLPILRADFEVAENNNLDSTRASDVPIFAMMGDQEEKCEQISNWNRFTSGSFDFKIMKGGHFFIRENPELLAGIIRKCYDENIIS